ncbi:DUF1501 domain-containing protein [Tautonia sociabilis]|uniref:DUF1501 domain-containing protein n=1 Tax=Tautonia sociabilis TaxID=2080755 RepID=A0A432MPV2_9BACT|nr:DUF1501 domain-containing protein [Tautonia sociabilis]RUL89501.1 DUF1501 domain-containing protein [Tautonia sociabilis]
MRSSDRNRPCLGPSRRALLRVGVLGALGLGLDDVLRLRAHSRAEDVYGTEPTLSGTPRAKSCILVWLSGGPSHIDTWDPKPDAPADVRGEFAPIETSIPGVRISEILPELAKVLDRAMLIRSITSPEAEHDRASHHMLTGSRPSPALVYPSFGSVLAKVRGFSNNTLPPYAAIPSAPLFSSSGYLTPAYDPFAVAGDPNQPGFRVRDLTPPDRLTLDRLRRRREMVATLDRFAADAVVDTPLTTSRDTFAEQAYDLLTSSAAQEAFRIQAEPDDVRERFGRTQFGQSLLLARRLVEAGVGFVTVNDQGSGPVGWDTHVNNFPMLKDTLAPPIDRGIAALIADLADRGLLDETLVVVMGEFGRTPKINDNAGRDHHGRASSVLLAGGGMPAGLVLGATDAIADLPSDRPVTPNDLAATLYTALGINPDHRFLTPDGQPIRLVDGGRPVDELLS